MKDNELPFYARILLVFGIGVALAVALDNISIGIGVATVFLAAIVSKKKTLSENLKENNE